MDQKVVYMEDYKKKNKCIFLFKINKREVKKEQKTT